MIPRWKIKREWDRLKQQLVAIPEFFLEPLQRRRHDAIFERGLKWSDGACTLDGKIALLLLFQPNGVADSIIHSCQHLVRNGYAPFIVSNTPLSAEDYDKLSPVSWRIMERPNFGYDFGGYRDGILQLQRWAITPDRLLVLNDSVWFPLWQSEGLIDALEASSADLTGTILRERGAIRFLESYCYMVPKRTFESEDFRAFWSGIRLTSNKYKVIRRGERGFSEAMIAAGFSVQGLFPYEQFLKELEQQNDDFLRKTLIYSAHSYEGHENATKQLLADPNRDRWRAQVLEHIRATIPREQPYSAYPYAMIKMFGYPLLKKSNDRAAHLWRTAYLKAVEAGDLPAPSDPIKTELRNKAAMA